MSPGRRLQAGQLGDPADELFLGHRLAVGQVEDFADGGGVLGGEKDPVNQVLDVDAVEHLLAGPEVHEAAAPEVQEQLGQDGAVALAVDEPRPDDRRRQPALAMVFEDQGLGLGLGSRVGVERIRGGGHGLVGPVMVAPFVHAERADVDEPLEPGVGTAASSSKRSASTLSRRNSSSVPQSPTLAAQLNTQSAPATPARSASGSSRSPTIVSTPHWSSQRVSLVGRTRARTRWPRFRASSVAWLPTSPVAPVMKIVFDVVVFMTLRTGRKDGLPQARRPSYLMNTLHENVALAMTDCKTGIRGGIRIVDRCRLYCSNTHEMERALPRAKPVHFVPLPRRSGEAPECLDRPSTE